MVQQGEEFEALAHFLGAGEHMEALEQVLLNEGVGAVLQQNLGRCRAVNPITGHAETMTILPLLIVAEARQEYRSVAHLQTDADAHVVQEMALHDGTEAGHPGTRHPPQVAEVHVGCQVCGAWGLQRVVKLVTSKPLKIHKKKEILMTLPPVGYISLS